jgi:hypothetical protein
MGVVDESLGQERNGKQVEVVYALFGALSEIHATIVSPPPFLPLSQPLIFCSDEG